MKKIGLLIILFSFVAVTAMAGHRQPGRKMKALKVAYVTRQLNLTPEEAEKFWPVYNNYIEELRKARFNQQDDILVQEENALNLRKKYRTEFKKLLNTDARANRALMLERDFNNIIRKELQKRREIRKEKTDKN